MRPDVKDAWGLVLVWGLNGAAAWLMLGGSTALMFLGLPVAFACIAINLVGPMNLLHCVLPGMVARGGGYLMNTASAAGLLSQIGSAPYAVTKHAAVGLAEWLALTHGDDGIKVSVLCPQAVRTAMTAGNPDGVASIDGMMEPDVLAECCVKALADETFLILPHPEVLDYMRRKTADYDRWIGGMRKLNRAYRG